MTKSLTGSPYVLITNVAMVGHSIEMLCSTAALFSVLRALVTSISNIA